MLLNPKLSRTAGFTLLELLVVVLLIGIIANFAVLSMSGRALTDKLSVEAQRLNQLVQLAAEEAQVKGLNLGLLPLGRRTEPE